MKVKTVTQAASKYTRQSIAAYLEGRQSLNWVSGVIDASDPKHAQDALRELENYGDHGRFQDLVELMEEKSRNLTLRN